MSADPSLSVLITTSTFPYRQGDGQARFVLDLATALSEQASVTVLAPHATGAHTRERIGSVTVRRYRYFFPGSAQRLSYGVGMRHNLEQSWLARIQVPFLVVAQLLATVSAVLLLKPSVINAHWLVPQGLTTAVVSRLFGVPMVLHAHAADVYFLRRRRIGRAIARFVVRSSSAVLADGSHVRDSLDELLGFESGAGLRPMGVWFSRFEDNTDEQPESLPENFVLFVGRLVEKKGVEYLIRALVTVRLDRPDLELVIAGTGPLQGQLTKLANELGVAGAVHFIGPRSHAEVAAMMQLAEVVSVPSIIDSRGETEGMPTVVLEGMAAGARVVGTAVNGIPDVLRDAENGWLVKPADAASLAEGILAALEDPAAEEVRRVGTETACKHDWAAVAEEYGSTLRAAADGRSL